MELYTGQLKNADFNINTKQSRGKYRKCFDIFSFDVENCNAWVDSNGHVFGYEKGKGSEYWEQFTPLAVVYIWQFSFNDKVYYGRDLWDFLQVLNDLPQDKLIIWCHNLSHEWVFLQNILTVKDVFARTPHKPMKCTFEEYPHIEFRCSYFMTNLSLENWGKQIGCNKLVGLLDYDKLYTPYSDLTSDELSYAEQDCVVVYQGIKKELEKYGDVFNVPITSTGKIRRVVKNLLYEDPNYRKYIRNLVPTYEQYKFLLEVFSGGYCHCNRLHSNRIRKGLSHFDFTSSYPTVLLSEKYVTGKWIKSSDKVLNKGLRDNYAYMYRLKFYNVKSTNPNTYFQIYKCKTTGRVIKDNGRIKDCDGTIEICLFDTDVEIIRMLYKWDRVEVIEKWYGRKDYLPKIFLNYVLQLYSDKTTLKNVKGQEDFYSQQKAFLNSLYGLCVCKPLQEECVYTQDSHEWHIMGKTQEDMERKLKDLKNPKKQKDTRYFLSFTWGCQCTAYARYNLFRCAINEQTRNGWDCVYFDTDSAFILGNPSFDWYNKEIDEKLRKCCLARGLDFEKTRPLDIKGIPHPLGWFEREDDIKEFKCIHAKCYIEKRYDDNLYMTISGINKGAVDLLRDENGEYDIDMFDCGFSFDADADCVKKLIPTYNFEQPTVVFDDGYVSKFKCGKNLRRTGYKIDITDEYAQLLGLLNTTFNDLEDAQIIRLYGKV